MITLLFDTIWVNKVNMLLAKNIYDSDSNSDCQFKFVATYRKYS